MPSTDAIWRRLESSLWTRREMRLDWHALCCIVIVADLDVHWRGSVRDLSTADIRWRESGGLCRGWDVAGMSETDHHTEPPDGIVSGAHRCLGPSVVVVVACMIEISQHWKQSTNTRTSFEL